MRAEISRQFRLLILRQSRLVNQQTIESDLISLAVDTDEIKRVTCPSWREINHKRDVFVHRLHIVIRRNLIIGHIRHLASGNIKYPDVAFIDEPKWIGVHGNILSIWR